MYFTWNPETNVLTACDFATWKKIPQRILAQEQIGIFVVSTIFLGIEARLFEVALFDSLQLLFLKQSHYSNSTDALAAHQQLVQETTSYSQE